MGSPRAVTNASAGIVSRHDYMPFGEEVGSGVGVGGRTPAMGFSVSDGLRQKFTQKERDIEMGLDYFLARYHSSTQGRFTSPDEFTGGPDELYTFVDDASANPTFYADLTNPQSLNKYHYTYNNPLRYTDPTGHCVGILAPICTPVGQRVIERAMPYAAAVVAALATAVAARNSRPSGTTMDDCRSCRDLSRFGPYGEKDLLSRHGMRSQDNSGGANAKPGGSQNASNTASPNPNDPNKKPVFGERGTQTTSTTVGKGQGWRVDVENPNPGQRSGQIHYQSGDKKLFIRPEYKEFHWGIED